MPSPQAAIVRRILAPAWVWLAVCCFFGGCALSDRRPTPFPLSRDARLEKKIADRVANDPFPTAREIGL